MLLEMVISSDLYRPEIYSDIIEGVRIKDSSRIKIKRILIQEFSINWHEKYTS